ncbi:MAG: hypothetical protein Q7J78_05285, partial [Clostridiales bacterium]|nr:hypothetical protein [Clostridiales bacterium]
MYKLPYNKLNPIVYDNDSHEDVYTDEYLMALVSSGDIELKGMITTISYMDAWQKPEIQFESLVNGREELVGIARRSGMKNIPDSVRGPSVALKKPLSGRIEDTIPIDTKGSRLIVQEARLASPEKPLVIVMGGQATAVADAYLLDNSISKNIIVAWIVGEGVSDLNGYNGWVDPWADYIVLQRLKLVQFPASYAVPFVPKERLFELPDCELRQWLIDKQLPHVKFYGERDDDSQPVISTLNPDYVIETKTVSFDCWIEAWDGERLVPSFKEDIFGNAKVATCANKEIATDEWWRAMKNPKVWVNVNWALPQDQRPFYAVPFPIGTIERIEAEDFDHGGEGIAYNK